MTLRHLAIAAVVLVLVNAQLTWWIIFTTRQARERLELERELLDQRARDWVAVVAIAGLENEPPIPVGLEVVVAAEDKGFDNWIDTVGHEEGTMCWRWVRATDNPEPQTRVLKLSEL